MDRISAEYGWTDEQILNLTPARVRQISEEISRRHHTAYQERMHIAGLQSQVTAATFGGEKAAQSVSKAFQVPDLPERRYVASAAKSGEDGGEAFPEGLDFDPENPSHVPANSVERLENVLPRMFG